MTSMSRNEMDDLLHRLQRSNARHSRLAAIYRAKSRPMGKARIQAHALDLFVNLEAASTLEYRFVSEIPLPILDLSPISLPGHAAAIQPASRTVIAPIPRYPSRVDPHGLANRMARPGRPVLQCVIPSRIIISAAEEIFSSIPDESSRWSASTADTGESDYRNEEFDDDMDIPQPAPVRVRFPGSNDHESVDIIVSPNDDDVDPAEVQPVNNRSQSSRPPLPARVSRQAMRQGQGQNPLSPSAELPALAHSSSGSESSLEPLTPFEDLPIIMTSIKRKSLSDDVDTDDMGVDKRPRYEREDSASDRRAQHHAASSSLLRRNA